MENKIKQLLSEKRYVHSMAVASLARDLANSLGEDGKRAYLAGVVHDIAKEKPIPELIQICEDNNIPLTPVELANPVLIHAPAGAAILKDYGICDTQIENAVRYHTVGRADMTLIEKIIYFADMTEPNRVYKEVEELRALAKTDFDAAFAKAIEYSLIWNIEKGRLIHPGTLEAWNSILLERKTI